MNRNAGPVQGNSMALSAVIDNRVSDCERRLEWLYARRRTEAKPGEPWKYDGAIEHAKRELAAAIERENQQPINLIL